MKVACVVDDENMLSPLEYGNSIFLIDDMSLVPIKGMANITGGGIKNVPRMKDMKYCYF